MRIPPRVVTLLLLCCGVAFAEKTATIEGVAPAPAASPTKQIEEARDASEADDKAVSKDAAVHERKSEEEAAGLQHLVHSMKSATAGVAQKAAADAADEVSKPYMKRYSKSIHARLSAEKSAATAKDHLDKAMAERIKQNEAVVAALSAEEAAAVAATQHSESEAHLLENKLAALHRTEDAVRAKATKEAQDAAEKKIRSESQSKVLPFSDKADAAEKEAAEAKEAMEQAFRAKARAAALKAKALKLKNERAQLQKQEAQSSASGTQFIESSHVVAEDGVIEANAVSRKSLAKASIAFLVVGAASLGFVLRTTSAKAV